MTLKEFIGKYENYEKEIKRRLKMLQLRRSVCHTDKCKKCEKRNWMGLEIEHQTENKDGSGYK